MTQHPDAPRVVIIGGGLAGALSAIKIIDATRAPLALTLVEERAELGRGIAYSTNDLDHIVNGPARIFALHLDAPDHFTQWLAADPTRRGWRPPAGTALGDSFPPRALYGDYVQDELARALGDAGGRVTFTHVRDRAVDLVPTTDGFRVALRSGATRDADRVVLATGLFTSDRAIAVDPRLRHGSRYVADLWYDASALDGAEADRNILLLGTSLTALDGLISLEKRGYRGRYVAISRRGLLPQERREAAPWPDFLDPDALPDRVSELLFAVRRELKAIRAAGADWQRLPLAVKPVLNALWSTASDAERRRFARHLRVYWDITLHRAAPPTYGWLARARAEGRFANIKGRVIALDADGDTVAVTLRRRGASDTETLHVDRVVNGLGHEFDWRRIDDPLVRALLARQLVAPHATGYGIGADPASGAVLDRAGRPSTRLFAVGHPLRGASWESSAIPEQLAQATALGATFAGLLAQRRDVA
ncbi:FAD/NAD(P)-binding protein [Xanthobacter sp. V4C-4]|uniref:FAD/NAD(P)-binding protein n=1 Tax=Xanthobacter cornucopiae TaxID=3119924 RepID=UPI003726FE8C